MRGQGDNMLWRDRGLFGNPGLEIIEAALELVDGISVTCSRVLHGELCSIDFQPQARMGYQHLESHPETSPSQNYAAMCDRKKRWGYFSRNTR
jgi:hypothetical protein